MFRKAQASKGIPFQTVVKQLIDGELDEIGCCLARWINQDFNGQYLTVELSPKFVSTQRNVEQFDPVSELLQEDDHSSGHIPPWLEDK